MRTSYLYAAGLVLFLGACTPEKPVKKHYLIHKVVYATQNPIDSSGIIRARLAAAAPHDTSYLEYVFLRYNLVDIKSLDSSINIELKYADTGNYLKLNLYDGLRRAYFNCETAIKVCSAQSSLKKINPNYSLLVLDASRPQHIQQTMWDSLKMHPDKKYNYLSPPYETSLHNYGCAIDATIVDITTNQVLDMGTEFDHFDKLSQPIYEPVYLQSGELGKVAYQNRLLLRRVMKAAGLNPINSEWWHFSSCTKAEAIKMYALIK